MFNPRYKARVFGAIPVILLPAIIFLLSKDPVIYAFGLSSQWWAGFLVGMSAVMAIAAISPLLLKRKPK